MRVECAQAEDAAAVHALLEEAAKWLTARGIRQWTPGVYPADRITRGVARGEVFVVRGANGVLEATLQLQDADPEIWGADDGRALYLHRLTVARACAGQGVGAKLLEWALAEAAVRERAVLRLDCVASHAFLRRYYAAAGFRECGDVALGALRLTRFERLLPPRS